jgi:hypothetical protein
VQKLKKKSSGAKGLILPCPVTIVIKFGVTLIFSLNLSAILGKNYFVIVPFVVAWNVKQCMWIRS